MKEKEKRSRAIIYIERDKILLIHRLRDGLDYYVFPGGGVNSGERILDAVVREGKEELGVTLNPIKLLYELDSNKDVQYFFLCTIKEGVIGTGDGPEFSSENAAKGSYTPEVVSLKELTKYAIMPPAIRDQLSSDIASNKSLFNVAFKKLYHQD